MIGKAQAQGHQHHKSSTDLEVSDEHAELGAPVSHVVDAQGLVAEVLHEARDAVTNDGGAEVPHVHLLSNVG